jgi:hypothetical protein
MSEKTLRLLLDAVCGFLRRYVVFSLPEQPTVIALWAAHAWTFDAFDYTPYLHVYSAEKRSGKTRLLDVLQLVTPKPWRAVSPSVPVLFRRVERDKPTLLYDEVDTVFHDLKKDGTEDVRSLLNTGFERGATISRCVGQNANLDLKDFDVFCAKALSGIGRCLPDTVSDRCVPVELRRQSREEKAERFRKRDAESKAAGIRAGLEAWAQSPGLIDTLRSARPMLPDELTDRQQDISEPLLAIADLAGGEWPEKARCALIKLCCQSEDASLGVKLLTAIRGIFDAAGADKLTTKDILEALVATEDDAPWALWFEDALKHDELKGPASRLARMLKPYGIKPGSLRLAGDVAKGYARIDFEPVWKLYLPAVPTDSPLSVTNVTKVTHEGKGVTDAKNVTDTLPNVTDTTALSVTGVPLVKRPNVTDVTDVTYKQEWTRKGGVEQKKRPMADSW